MAGLRIAMLTTFYPPYSFGGDAIGIQRLAQALVDRGHDVTVIHDEDAFLTLGGKATAPESRHDQPKRIGLRSGMGLMSNLLTQQTGRPLVHGRRIRGILEEGNFDIIWHNNASLVTGPGFFGMGDALQVYEAHEHWLVCPMHVLWRYNRELCDKRKCLSCTLSFRRPPQWWRYTGLLERKARKIDLFIAKSEFSRRKHAEFGFSQPMETVPYFLPDVPQAKDRPETDRPYFLFVGRLEKIKGLQDVIPLFRQDPGADLVIIGDGEYRAELEAQANGIASVKFMGRMPPEDLARWYKGAISLIVPSACYETFGIILIESFRMGTPVIARRLGPFPEIVERAKAGLLFETADDLRDAIIRFRDDKSFRDGTAKAARAAFETIWTEEAVLKEYARKLTAAAARAGRTDLAKRLERGEFENGTRLAGA